MSLDLQVRDKGNFWRDSFGILYTGYLLSIVKIKRERKRGGGKGDKTKGDKKCDIR